MSGLYRKPHRIGVALLTAAALLATVTPAGHHLEGLLPDWTARFVPQAAPTHKVAVVAIEADSLAAYGPWPWPHRRLAEVVQRLQRFRPQAVGIMLPLTATETPRGLDDLNAQLDTLDAPLRKRAAAWLRQLDTDAQLSRTLQQADNVVLAAPLRSGAAPYAAAPLAERFTLTATAPSLPWHVTAWRRLASAWTWQRDAVSLPAGLFSAAVSGIGATPVFSDGQRVRGTPMVVATGGHYLPGFELALLAAARQLRVRDLRVNPQTAFLDADPAGLVSTGFDYYPRPAETPPVYALKDVMTSDPQARKLRGRTVVLGLSAPGLVPQLGGPAGHSYTPLTWSAHVLDSLMAGQAFTRPDWFFAAQRGLLVLLGVYLLLLPAGWRGTRGLVASGLLAAALLNTGLLVMITRSLWVPVVLPTLFLLVAQLLLWLAHRWYSVLDAARRACVEARIALGGNLQSQGQLDRALEQFALCLPDPAAREPLYELGLEYERRRQVSKARSVYARLEQCSRNFRDCAQRRAQLDALSERFPTASPAAASKTLVLDAPHMELPVLGRYRLERELGRGAMGTVYLATDPTIGRELAVKTLPILQAGEGREQAEIAARFFREAEAVGRLDHANIVSVHDAGKDHDLAYIAMDYVPGESLDAWTGRSALLPVWEVLDIAAQVADALAYAHGRKVVHRDIKPANIIYDRDNGVAKITDFGVARILDASGTRSGTVLGTPSYMSPEQVAGKKTDGRSDLFSLGTTIYQLLTGSLPFEGDSIATLMYRITSQDPRPLRKVRRGLPVCVGRLVARALQKDPAKRFASGEAMAAAVLNCRAQFKGGRRKTA